MRLRYSPTSPFVRKVTVTALELGLDARITRVPANGWDPTTDLVRDNPLSKVPTLVLDSGECLYDSPVICEYLDTLAGGRLLPASGAPRWTALRRQALADGLLDAAVLVFVERGRRPEALRWPAWIGFQLDAVSRALDVLEGEADALAAAPTLGEIAIGCALGWIEFRKVAADWRDGRPRLAHWYAGIAARPSFAATIPCEPT